MSKHENDANNAFRPSDSPLTEHEKHQIAVRKNLERLRAERLAREAEQKDSRKSWATTDPRKSPSLKCAPPAFAVSWFIADLSRASLIH
jgi:hypothetical protein